MTSFDTHATITMSVYFHATQQEMEDMGDDFVLAPACGTRAVQSTAGSQAQLWSPKGALLATTEQVCWFKQFRAQAVGTREPLLGLAG